MTTLAKLNAEIDRQVGSYRNHPSVPWFNRATGSNYVLNAYFCASGLSQAFDKIGLGKATGGPFIWTVAWYQWCRRNLKSVGLAGARPGDIVFMKFGAAGDRGGAVVNHVTTFRGVSGGSVLVKGFNEGSGGTGGYVGDAAYGRGYVVAVFRTPFVAAGASAARPVKPAASAAGSVSGNGFSDEDEVFGVLKGMKWNVDAKTVSYAVFNDVSGFWSTFGAGKGNGLMPDSYISGLKKGWGVDFPTVSKAHAEVMRKAVAAAGARR